MFEKGAEGRSQSNEDEIIAKIFRGIGEGGKRFVEFGCGDGRQNNTLALLLRGWSGLWIDVHRRRIVSARLRWGGYPVEIIRHKAITPDNVNELVVDPIDFLSIDVDGGDYAIWEALEAMPRVVCIEYGEQPDTKGKPSGASLKDMVELGKRKGYYFAGTSASHVNAFFVRGERRI